MSLTLTELNNGRTGTYYYYGDVIKITGTTSFTTLYLCIGTTYQTLVCNFPDATTETTHVDNHGNTYYDYDNCYFCYTVTNLIYGQEYFFSTNTTLEPSSTSFTCIIQNDLTIQNENDLTTYIYSSDSEITISSEIEFNELYLCKSVDTDAYRLCYSPTGITSFTTNFSNVDVSSLSNNTFTLETGYYFVGTSYNKYISAPFLYCDITLDPLKSSYYEGESVTFSGTYDLYSSGDLISSSHTSPYTFSYLTDGTEYYFMSESKKTPTFKYRSTSTSFYLNEAMDTYFNKDDLELGQTHKIIDSQFNLPSTKQILVPFGGNNVDDQQGTSEAHCYFVTSIVNQYMTIYMSTYTGTPLSNNTNLNNLLDNLMYSINFMCESISLNTTSPTTSWATTDTYEHIFFSPWEFYITNASKLKLCVNSNGTVPDNAQDSNQQLTCSLLRLWKFNQQYPYSYICNKLINSSDMAALSLTTTFDWNYIHLSDADDLSTTLNVLIQQCINNLTQIGNYVQYNNNIIFGSQTVSNTATNSIETFYFLDYVSFYLYVLIQDYIDITTFIPTTSVNTYYIYAIKRCIDWILGNDILTLIQNSGDDPYSQFNRLAFQASELIEVYNNGDSTIGLSSYTVKTYFDFVYYNKLCAILNKLISYEIGSNALYFENFNSTSTSLQFYYIQSIDNNTFVSSTSIIGGYYRMISYLLMMLQNRVPLNNRPNTDVILYLENMTFDQLLGDTYSNMLLGQVTDWGSNYNDGTFSDYWMLYLYGDNRYSLDTSNSWSAAATSSTTKSWSANTNYNDAYFAWHMGTLHMSCYRMNN